MAERVRPVFLNLTQIKLPVGALTSIGHRISGVVLAINVPIAIYLLQRSLGAIASGRTRAHGDRLPQQAGTRQGRQPLSIAHIGLAPGDVLGVAGVDDLR